MRKLAMFLAFVGTALLTISSANAAINTFDTDPGAEWYQDRYAPAVFERAMFDGDYRLRLGLRAEDNEAGRAGTPYASGFYNYQGRKIDTPNNGVGSYVSVDMYADATWLAGTRAGMWATASNGNLSYPIIEFCVSGDNSGYGGSADFTGFRWWQSEVGWSDGIAMTADDAWHNLMIVMGADTVEFYLDGNQFGTADNLHADSIDNVILQGHNQGTAGEYDIYYDNFISGETYVAPAVPEPASLLIWSVLGAGCTVAAAVRRRRRAS